MDRTERYKLMAWKAKEIQELTPSVSTGYEKSYIEGQKCFTPVWLPRQDELQEMIDIKRHSKFWVAVHESAELKWIVDEEGKARFNHHSYEQNWLAFIMFEKYNKTWNGEDWIK